MEMGHILTAMAAFAGMAVWDILRTWVFSKWMMNRISRNSSLQSATCPKCGSPIDVRVNISDRS